MGHHPAKRHGAWRGRTQDEQVPEQLHYPEEVVKKNGADAFRQWAAIGGTTGSDIIFSWKDVIAGSRFLQKLWSIVRFSTPHISDKPAPFTPIDLWLLSKLNRLVKECTEKMDAYQFDETFKAIRGFAWEILADNYIELAKSRLYGEGEGKEGAQYSLFISIDTLSRLLAPFLPYFSEEIYSHLKQDSVHIAQWPQADESLIDPDAEAAGELIKEITAAIRRYKSEHGMALNAELAGIGYIHPWKMLLISLARQIPRSCSKQGLRTLKQCQLRSNQI